jgi:hypothetical protein|nr:MAG TPA: hypothetical protein [Caudoviricetes sp.]
MALSFNGTNIPSSGNVIFNGTYCKTVSCNNVEVWKKEYTVYPGAPVANTQNLGYAAYFTVTNSGTDIKVDAFGGTERGYGRVMLGGFNSWGYSKIYFSNLSISLSNSFSHAKVALSDINGNVVQQLIYRETGEAGGVYVTYAASDIFTINAENGNYYLMLEVASGATGGGLHATIQMNGCYLI